MLGSSDVEHRDHDLRTSGSEPDGVADRTESHRARSARRWVAQLAALLLGLTGVAAAVALPFLPVFAESTTVSWPAEGQQARPTTAFFVPYRPAELHVEVPCPVLRAGLAQPERATVFATTTTGTSTGLVVISESGALRVLLDGRLVPGLPDPLPANCDLRVDADAAGATVALGDAPAVRLPGADVPEVFTFDTALDAEQARGMSVTARTPRWFQSSPTGLKVAVAVAQAVVAVGALAVLAATGRSVRRRQREREPDREPGDRGSGGADGIGFGVVVTLALWAVIGPLTDDDGFAMMTVRNAEFSGDVGNYYRWFNASEVPFTLLQHLVSPLLAGTLAPVWLRVPSVVAGVLTWAVISRGVLRPALPGLGRARWLRLVAAGCFLAWWLPYGLGLRPEPFVALGTVVVLALLLRATGSRGANPLRDLGLAALVAGLTVAVTPTGILVLAPVLVLAARIRLLLGTGVLTVATRVALLGALAAAAVTVMFADQTWHGLLVATEIHDRVGPSLRWFEENVRYEYLLSDSSWGSAAKRLPVLLTVTMLVPAVALLGGGARSLDGLREAHLLLAGVPVAMLALWLTPSKWSHHFGALAGLGTVALAAAVAVVVTTSRRTLPDRATIVAGGAGGLLVVLVTGLAFAGPNAWWAYSEFGMAFADQPVRPLHNPLLWLGGSAAVAALLSWRNRRRRPGRGAVGAGVVALPAVAASLAVAGSVAVLLATFLAAPLQRAGLYSLAGQNLGELTGESCGIVENVEVLIDPPGGVLEAAPDGGSDDLGGFVSGGGYPSNRPAPSRPGTGPARYLWGSLAEDELSTGELTSRWFTLPDAEGQELTVSVGGRADEGNSVAVEFGIAGPDGAVAPAGSYRLVDPEPRDRPFARDAEERRELEQDRDVADWRGLAVPPGAIPADTDRVRVRAVDGSTDEQGWVAATGPRLRTPVPLERFLAGRSPVFVDWPVIFAVPCQRDLPVVAGGLAEAPAAIVAVPNTRGADKLWYRAARLSYRTETAGSFVGVYSVGRVTEVDSRLVGDPGRAWGRVLLVDYGMARDAYSTRATRVRLPGWQGDPGCTALQCP